MTSKINALSTGAGGIATTADASGILEIQTNSTTAMTVSDSQVISFNNNFGAVAGLPSYQCRAWVNFNGTGTVAIRASGNVSSITDIGTGTYTVNFTNAMVDVNYCASMDAGSNNLYISTTYENTFTDRTTTSIKLATVNTTSNAVYDSNSVNVAIFR